MKDVAKVELGSEVYDTDVTFWKTSYISWCMGFTGCEHDRCYYRGARRVRAY